MAGGGVAVEVDGAGLLRGRGGVRRGAEPSWRVGHHVGVEEEGFEGAHSVGNAAALLDDFFVSAHGVGVPLPCVLEGVDLGAGLRAVFLGEEDVVVLAGVEGRIEVDEIDGLVLDVAPEDFVDCPRGRMANETIECCAKVSARKTATLVLKALPSVMMAIGFQAEIKGRPAGNDGVRGSLSFGNISGSPCSRFRTL